MNEKETKFIEFIHSKKFLGWFFALMTVLFAVGWVVLVMNENRVSTLNPDDVRISNPADYAYYLDNVSVEKKGFITVSGWIIKPGERVNKVAIKVVLKDSEDGKFYVAPTDVQVRPDVTAHFNDGNNYDYCGFSMRIPYWEKLDTEADYELFAQYDLNDNARAIVPFNALLKQKAAELKNAK